MGCVGALDNGGGQLDARAQSDPKLSGEVTRTWVWPSPGSDKWIRLLGQDSPVPPGLPALEFFKGVQGRLNKAQGRLVPYSGTLQPTDYPYLREERAYRY